LYYVNNLFIRLIKLKEFLVYIVCFLVYLLKLIFFGLGQIIVNTKPKLSVLDCPKKLNFGWKFWPRDSTITGAMFMYYFYFLGRIREIDLVSLEQILLEISVRACLALRFNLYLIEFQFFLLKLSAVCTFWIVLMCWCQK
jgi:hypothetical protein